MPPVLVEISRRPEEVELTEVEFVDDLEAVLEANKCACNASDDNPF